MNKRGRPKRDTAAGNNKQKIIDVTVELVKKHGADAITVRGVCEAADLSISTFYHYFANKDDLLMYFVRETSFDAFVLETPLEDVAGRITELYMLLIRRYQELGLVFMKQFYTTGNKALWAYMGAATGHFPEGTVMARCESELEMARQKGAIAEKTDVHQVSADVCTIVKGCVFEWCLGGGTGDVEKALHRILTRYFCNIMT